MDRRIINKWVLIIFIKLFLLSCNNSSDNEKQIEEAIKFANVYSDTKSKKDWNDKYWDHLCSFMSNDEYNKAAILSRLSEAPYSGEDSWRWITDSLRLEYCSMRNNLK